MSDPGFDFELDRFQREAIEAFDAGESVLVAAPTGSGKTVIAEHGIGRTLAAGKHSFYTSPIKALANQKFRDFCRRFGPDQVGLLTGDLTIRGDAPVVVMTTEVLRNMLYERSRRVGQLGCVVLDEVHYLQDRFRGPVWEEVLLNLPPQVRTISLSATVSNLDEFVGWLSSVRGPTTLVVERSRPVPLRHLLGVTDGKAKQSRLVPLLDGERISDEAHTIAKWKPDRGRTRSPQGRHRGRRPKRPPKRWLPPRRTELIPRLVNDDLAPLIWFIFSRNGCDEAVDQCMNAGLRFTDADQRDRLGEILDDRTHEIDDESWFSLGLDRWQRAFESGIAAHHAGLIPAAKEAVEVAFAEGLLTVVFATETLALGVNLPARTVVVERLVKYDGEDHKLLTPMEFTQLTGRAGRRGLDVEGTAVSCYSHRVSVDDLATLAASTEYPLRSAFTPNYNMVANLMRRTDRTAARSFVARSFAQYQVDATAVVGRQREQRDETRLRDARENLRCDRGDVLAWLMAEHGQERSDDEALGQLRPGDVVETPGTELVVSVAHRSGRMQLTTIDGRGERRRRRAAELPASLRQIGHVSLPPGLGPNDERTTVFAMDQLEGFTPTDDGSIDRCPRLGEHRAAFAEVQRLTDKLAKRRRSTDRRIGRLERDFDAVADLLHAHGFAHEWNLTEAGGLLTSVHGDTELVLAEALHLGTLDRLAPPELAAALSALSYQARRGVEPSFRWPTKNVRRAIQELKRRADFHRRAEEDALGRALTRQPDADLVAVVYGWATGEPLDAVLPDEMSGGDFVRSMRQLIDLCRQVAQTPTAVADVAADAILCLDHGVVRNRYDLFLEDTELDRDVDDDDPTEIDQPEAEPDPSGDTDP